MKTYAAKPGEVPQRWYLVDAENQVLGRLAAELARRLRGKHKPQYTPHTDTGDYLVIVNAAKVAVTGNKLEAKRYYHHTGYPGGIRETKFADLLERHPEQIIERAVRGMLPRNRLGRAMLRKLKVYPGTEHPHAAQQPEPLKLN